MMQTTRLIRLGGQLGKKFGKTHRLVVADTREALRALCITLPGFESFMMNAHKDGVQFAFFNGPQNIGLAEFATSKGSADIRIMPVIAGSKSAGGFQIILGVAALVGAFFTAGGTIGLYTSALAASGATATLSATAVAAVSGLTMMGASMVLGGVMQLMMPQPNFGMSSSQSVENKPSYAFGSPVNTTAQGYPVPVLYGEREIGGAVISAGIYAENQQ
ncbi:TPA: tail assembly protein [Serratia fonticola]|jgi:predicted phage tail protein|uniref:Phage-related protein, tail component n=1 Tax=Serratia fonticola TaxID=47917 RepID=A0A3S4YCD6_SERFO|nr:MULTISPECIES: tail assembly protein [Serratia]AYM91605.1 tail assembly protein [Serratia sp. 3ACOL1]MBL5906043.1 tail assembly protein [Serratia fonticola]MDK2376901.1 tail assembly protein [Serratia fonticola]CAI0883948.1 Phage-related protein, tail component [Serratia fonticola]CAI0981806.1 Phage-related protein, tail component [Serratia fonticola]